MTVFRIALRAYADLSGEGAKRYGGRCNPKGTAAVYCSEHISLCALEVLVHMDQRMVPDTYVVITINIPDNVPIFKGSPIQARSSEGMLPVWVTPSRIIPQEHNIILYPGADQFAAEIIDIQSFSFDPRLVAPKTVS